MNREISQMEISYGRWLQTLCLSLLVFVSSCTYGDTDRYSAKGKLVLSGPFGIVQKGTVHELPKADAENIQQEGN